MSSHAWYMGRLVKQQLELPRIPTSTLTRRCADASIWLNQFVKAMRDDQGELVRNAHLLGFFRRICRWPPPPLSPAAMTPSSVLTSTDTASRLWPLDEAHHNLGSIQRHQAPRVARC